MEWIKMSEKWPPFDEYVMVAFAEADWPHMEVNMLSKKDDGLYYWDGPDFDEVTHWATLPAMPPSEKLVNHR